MWGTSAELAMGYKQVFSTNNKTICKQTKQEKGRKNNHISEQDTVHITTY